MAQLGNDPDQLDRLAAAMKRSAQQMRASAREMDRYLQSTFWLGPDGEMFRVTWQTDHGPRLYRAADVLLVQARRLRRQAAEQRRTSNGGATCLATPNTITVTDLNAATGKDFRDYDPSGTDLNEQDLRALAHALARGRQTDIATTQEMPEWAAYQVQQYLEQETGDTWVVAFGDAGLDPPTYHPVDDQGRRDPAVRSRAGNATFVRLGSGIDDVQVLTNDGTDPARGVPRPDDGVRLPDTPGSVVGLRLTTEGGKQFDVYNTHLTNDDVGDPERYRANQVNFVRSLADQGLRPSIVTGDSNAEIGFGWPSGADERAIGRFVTQSGYRDNDAGGTSGDFGPWWTRRIDFMLTRDLDHDPASIVETDMSDHRGISVTIDPDDR